MLTMDLMYICTKMVTLCKLCNLDYAMKVFHKMPSINACIGEESGLHEQLAKVVTMYFLCHFRKIMNVK